MARFQESNYLIKAWRCRFYLVAIVDAARMMIETIRINKKNKVEYEDIGWSDPMLGWSIAIGIAEARMEWVYTQEEVAEHLKRFLDSL